VGWSPSGGYPLVGAADRFEHLNLDDDIEVHPTRVDRLLAEGEGATRRDQEAEQAVGDLLAQRAQDRLGLDVSQFDQQCAERAAQRVLPLDLQCDGQQSGVEDAFGHQPVAEALVGRQHLGRDQPASAEGEDHRRPGSLEHDLAGALLAAEIEQQFCQRKVRNMSRKRHRSPPSLINGCAIRNR
jgi:hypothetical protein